jgi:hypothetical protein
MSVDDHYSVTYYKTAASYLQGQQVRDLDPSYRNFSREQVYHHFEQSVGRKATTLKEAVTFLSHYPFLTKYAHKFKMYDLGCGRIYEPDYGDETCNHVYVLCDTCDCQAQDNWVTVIPVNDLLTKHYFDYVVGEYDTYHLPDGEEFVCHTVRREFFEHPNNHGYVYFSNMHNIPNNAKVIPKPVYSWGSLLHPETDLKLGSIKHIELVEI